MGKMMTLTVAIIAAMLLTACGGGSSNSVPLSTQESAIAKISNYTQYGGEAPTLQDYTDAGVIGVDESNLIDINEVVSSLTVDEVDTTEEIQALLDALGLDIRLMGPIFTSPHGVSVNENQTSAIQLVAIDESSSVTYSISGTDAESFTVNATTGLVTFHTAPDYETKNSYTFTAIATSTDDLGNGTGDYNEVDITIAILNVPEFVPTLANSLGEVSENAEVGTEVGTVTIEDSGDSNITAIKLITLSGTESKNFEVSTTGVITVKEGAILEYDALEPTTLSAYFDVSFEGVITVEEDSGLDYEIVGDTPIEYFDISSTGVVTLSETVPYEASTLLNSYGLIAVATNAKGDSTNVYVAIIQMKVQ